MWSNPRCRADSRVAGNRCSQPRGRLSRKRLLKPLDRLDGRRVDAVEHRQVDAHQVAEQHERQHALDARLAARADALDRRAGAGARSPAVSSIAAARGAGAGRRPRGRPPANGAGVPPRCPAADLVVVRLGQLARRTPAPWRSRSAASSSARQRRRWARRRGRRDACRAARAPGALACESSGASGPHSVGQRARAAGAAPSISSRSDGAAPHGAGALERADGHVDDGRARLHAGRARRSPARPGRGRASASWPPVVSATARRPPRPPPRSRRASPRCCRSSSRTARACPAPPRRRARSRARSRSGARRAVAERGGGQVAADRRAAHAAHDAARRGRSRRGMPAASQRQSASPSWCGWAEDVVEHARRVDRARSPRATAASLTVHRSGHRLARVRCARLASTTAPSADHGAAPPITRARLDPRAARPRARPRRARSRGSTQSRADEHAVVQHRALDRRVACPPSSARPSTVCGPMWAPLDEAAVVDQRAGLVARRQRRLRRARRAGRRWPRGSARASRCRSSSPRRA